MSDNFAIVDQSCNWRWNWHSIREHVLLWTVVFIVLFVSLAFWRFHISTDWAMTLRLKWYVHSCRIVILIWLELFLWINLGKSWRLALFLGWRLFLNSLSLIYVAWSRGHFRITVWFRNHFLTINSFEGYLFINAALASFRRFLLNIWVSCNDFFLLDFWSFGCNSSCIYIYIGLRVIHFTIC